MTKEEKEILEKYENFYDAMKIGAGFPMHEVLFVMGRAILILTKQALENQVTLEEIKTTVRRT